MAGAATASHPGIELHLIGPLQSNKAKEAVALFDAIHSWTGPSLCAALAKEIEAGAPAPRLFVEINTGAGAAEGGRLAGRRPMNFCETCRDTYGLDIAGLMCIPPPTKPRRRISRSPRKSRTRNGLKFLSMGMSADFPFAIAFGATHVRVGTAIFGART